MNAIKHFFTRAKEIIKKPEPQIAMSTPAAIIIGSVMITCGLVVNGFIIKSGTPASSGVQAPTVAMFAGKNINADDYVLGNKNSDVVVIEYSDPECPFCVQLSPVMKQIQNTYKDRVAFVYRHFPLTQIHPHAYDQARAIACSGAVGGETGYYKYIDSLFSYKYAKQTTELPDNGPNSILDLAKQAGLDVAKFTQCYNTQETAQIVNNEEADGVKAGVHGTPTTFVLRKKDNGYEVIALVDGARPIDAFTAPIDEALSK